MADGCTLVLGPLGEVWRAGGDTRQLVGADPRELAGHRIADLLGRADRQRIFEAMRGSILTGSKGRLRCDLVGDLGPVGVNVELEPLRGGGGVEQWVVRCEPAGRSTEAADRARLDLCAWAIERGLRTGEFDLDVQPIVELATSETIGYEALVRWARPGVERIPAGRFLPAVESAGLMAKLSREVLELGLQQLATWSPSSPDRDLSLNVVPADLVRPGFATDVANAVANAGIEPSRLVLEFAAGAFRGDPGELARGLARLRRVAGVRVAVDDYGAPGTSVPAHTLPIDVLKLDRSLTSVAALSGDRRALLGGLVSLTRSLGTVVIGAGIESPAQMEVLTAAGCEYGQGYLLGRPRPIGDEG